MYFSKIKFIDVSINHCLHFNKFNSNLQQLFNHNHIIEFRHYNLYQFHGNSNKIE
jgi:hypothetical protein